MGDVFDEFQRNARRQAAYVARRRAAGMRRVTIEVNAKAYEDMRKRGLVPVTLVWTDPATAKTMREEYKAVEYNAKVAASGDGDPWRLYDREDMFFI